LALKATVFKATLQVADMDRNVYGDHVLTIARHPSETDERMMVRVLAYALHAESNADAQLTFGGGVSTEDEPALWRRDLTGTVEQWIEVGLPDEKRIRRACGRAGDVFVYAYGGHAVELWWKQVGADLARNRNLSVFSLPQDATRALARLAQRNMQLNCTVQEGQVWLGDGAESVLVEVEVRQKPVG